jgi:hypothetical protein
MKTRDELLAMADEIVSETYRLAKGIDGLTPDPVGVNALANLAQACVMLAKERRESDEAPVVVTVPGTSVRPDIVATVANDVVRAIREARDHA